MRGISIIIPVYNVYSYIDVCLKSVLRQTWNEFEVILIDDGSTDGSAQKCRKWAARDSRIRFVQKRNEGLGIARNLGVEAAKYDYITFLDSDDWWDKKYLEQMMGPVLQTASDIVCCDIYYWERDKENPGTAVVSALRIEPEIKLSISENRELINTARTFMWGKVYKKTLFTDNHIEQPSHIYEDVAVTPFIIAKAESLYRVSQPLYYYRRNRCGSLANCMEGLEDMKLSLQELMLKFEQNNLLVLYEKPLKKLLYSQARFIIRKSRILCNEKESKEMEHIYFELLIQYFPEIEKFWKGIFLVEGISSLKTALQMIALDKEQVRDYKEAKELNNEFHERVTCILEVPGAGRIFFLSGVEKMKKCRSVRIDITFSANDAEEKQLWDLADKVFYEIWEDGG